jgi:hypothetical protein
MGQGASPDQARNSGTVDPQKAGDFFDSEQRRCIKHFKGSVGTKRKSLLPLARTRSISPWVEVKTWIFLPTLKSDTMGKLKVKPKTGA